MTKTINRGATIFGELLGVIITYFVLNSVLPILPFVNTNYVSWVPIAWSTAVISAAINIVRSLVNQEFSHGLKALALLPTMYSTYQLVRIFPFDFSLVGYSVMNSVVQMALYVCIFCTVVACAIHIIKFMATVPCKE